MLDDSYAQHAIEKNVKI